jgi:hypothetical protein
LADEDKNKKKLQKKELMEKAKSEAQKLAQVLEIQVGALIIRIIMLEMRHNASAVKIYCPACSLVGFEIKNIFYFEKCTSLEQLLRCTCKFSSRRIVSRCK